MSLLRCFMPVLSIAVLTSLVGCSGAPSRIEPPSISASGSAAKAMELYDSNSDGFLDSTELEQAPGLNAAIETLDTDGDSKVSESEIENRILSWQASKAGITSILCYVTMDGEPLPGAKVTFEPESFLGEEIQAAEGETNRFGVTGPSIPKEKRPIADMPPGMQLGFYRVRVSKIDKGNEKIPAKYNTETVLGQQMASDDPATLRQRISLDLKSK